MIPMTSPMKLWGGLQGMPRSRPVQITFVVEGRENPHQLGLEDWRQIRRKIESERRAEKMDFGKGWHPDPNARFAKPVETEDGSVEYHFTLWTGDETGDLHLIFVGPIWKEARP